MPLPPWLQKRDSPAKGPDYSAKNDTKAVFSGRKVLRSEANYRPAKEDSFKQCSECEYYENPGQPKSSCAKVVGVIDAEGVSDLFRERQGPPTKNSTSITIQIGPGPR